MQTRDEAKVSAAWSEAGRRLGLEVMAPFMLRSTDGDHECLAYLPDFAGSHGIVLLATRPPDFPTNQVVAAKAEAHGYAWSFVNVLAYEDFDLELFTDALREWGFTGPSERRPTWL